MSFPAGLLHAAAIFDGVFADQEREDGGTLIHASKEY